MALSQPLVFRGVLGEALLLASYVLWPSAEAGPADALDEKALTYAIANDVYTDPNATQDEVSWAYRFLTQEFDLCVLTN